MRTSRKSQQKGLSLVEVMIAITIGSVLMVGIVQLFVANGESHYQPHHIADEDI